MPVEWNGDELRETVEKEMATRLLRAAVFYQSFLMRKFGVSNPRPHKTPSKEGEYPKKRTGFGQAGVVLSATSIKEVRDDGMVVKAGELKNAHYMLILTLFKRRLGFLEALAEVKPQLTAIMGTTAA